MLTRLITISAVAAALVFAQRPQHDNGGTPADPQTMIERRVNFLTTLLSLTDAQKASATTIFTNAYSATVTPRADLQTARDSMAAAVKAGNTATIDTLATTIGTATAQLVSAESKAEAAFYALLTADQKAKYDAMPHGGFGGGPGPRGFGRQAR